MLEPLPIDEHLPEIRARVRESRAAVVVAPPGAGKTTRVGPALAEDGPVLLLEPRRIAARALARRIAAERRWTLGQEVGWHVRHERRFSKDTRLVIATEGILTRRLQGDPLLSDFRTLILDEFHERGLNTDLGLALARHAARARGDLAIVVMSATLDAGPVAEYLGQCPVIDVPGRLHPVEVSYAPHTSPAEALVPLLARDSGHVLCFLAGAPEILRLARELAPRTERSARPTDILPLYGALSAEDQDAALAPSSRRKLILATNVAETSLTVEGVTDVVDSGLHKVLRRDEGLGLDRLELERIPADCAAQRAGRAGRTAPGRALRLWDARDELRPRREPEILRVDLARPLLEVLAWGADPASFDWFEPPPAESLSLGLELLTRMGAVEHSRITERGRKLQRLPLHPRLAAVMLDTEGSRTAAAACAALAEGVRLTSAAETTSSDALALADRLRAAPAHVRQAAEEIEREASRLLAHERVDTSVPEEERLRRALLGAYPERVARRRAPGSPRLLLASGHGAVLAPESGVREGEFLVALDVVAAAHGRGGEAFVRLASRIEAEWLEPTRVEVEHRFDEPSSSVRAVERALHGALPLRERPVTPDPEIAARMLAERLRARGPSDDDRAWLARARFAGLEVDLEELMRRACTGRTTLPEARLSTLVPHDVQKQLERLAPETLALPSGRRVSLDYREDGTVHAQAKLQELFGLAETPRIGPRREPVTFSLLAPNGRPVQTTRDLRGFWDRTYPEVRKELRGRYPKHPWPDDPWSATPTARAKRR